MKIKVVKIVFNNGFTMYAEPENVEWFYEMYGTEFFGGKIKEVTKPFIMEVI